MVNASKANILAAFALMSCMPFTAKAEGIPHPNTAAAPKQFCTVSGWIGSHGAHDISLYEKPDSISRVIANIPSSQKPEEGDAPDVMYANSLNVYAAEDQWLYVSYFDETLNSDTSSGAASVSGWIPADTVRFGIQSGRGYKTASAQSERIVDLNDEWATELGVIERLWGCQDDWALIDYRQTLYRDKGELKDIPSYSQKMRQSMVPRHLQ